MWIRYTVFRLRFIQIQTDEETQSQTPGGSRGILQEWEVRGITGARGVEDTTGARPTDSTKQGL